MANSLLCNGPWWLHFGESHPFLSLFSNSALYTVIYAPVFVFVDVDCCRFSYMNR